MTATTGQGTSQSTTRERILELATNVVQRSGYHALHFADLADGVGIKKASLHYHFPTKEALGRTVMTTYRQQMRGQLAEIDAGTRDPMARLAAYVGLYRGVIDGSADHMCPGGMLAAETMSLPKELRQQMLGFFQENEEWVANVIADLRPELDAAARMRMAREVIATLQGHLLIARLYQDGSVFDLVWSGLEQLLMATSTE
ncbi:TetR/AcrR family transcriptional regulator [Nocardioides terrisoli]|uniref:TetR/AcrR family transcriptional regulator n=1 Tax=Nocardioides terrisoli TaxID=3388267 RepID=UPI00287BC92D|nr:TetR/AcrR family transcriptional regulator [Nocardioides marmorisolisilvae]